MKQYLENYSYLKTLTILKRDSSAKLFGFARDLYIFLEIVQCY